MITRPDLEDSENTLDLSTFISHSKDSHSFKAKSNRATRSYPYVSQNANYSYENTVVNSQKKSRLDRKNMLLDPFFAHSLDSTLNASMEISFNEFMTDNRLPRIIEDDLYPKDVRTECKDKICDNSLKEYVESFSSTVIDSDTEDIPVRSNDYDQLAVNYSPKSAYVEKRLCQTYDTSSIIFSNDDEMRLGAVNCNDILKPSKTFVDNDFYASSLNTTDCSSVDPESPEEYFHNHLDQLQDQYEEDQFYEENATVIEDKKGKISDMQRIALDAIFTIVDRPSRGLVLHISEQLRLHHITIKNFFSNGRRRLRRAAARVNDPERTRRENQRRKEKRRLASLAAALSKEKAREKNVCPTYNNPVPTTSTKQKDQYTISPERKKLMEKLAVKIQKSVAQKARTPALASDSAEYLSNNAHSVAESSPGGAIFSRNEHSNHNESFHLYASSQNKHTEKHTMNELYQDWSPNEPFDFYTANLCQDSVYPNDLLAGDAENHMPAKRTRPFSPLNWKSLLYA